MGVLVCKAEVYDKQVRETEEKFEIDQLIGLSNIETEGKVMKEESLWKKPMSQTEKKEKYMINEAVAGMFDECIVKDNSSLLDITYIFFSFRKLKRAEIKM